MKYLLYILRAGLLPVLLAGCGSAPGNERVKIPPELQSCAKDLAAEDAAVRIAAVKSLAQATQPEAVDLLQAALKDTSPHVRRWAVWALGHKSDKRAVIVIIGRLEDPDANVRCAAASALGRVPDVNVVGHVANRLADPCPAVRLAAADQLAQHVAITLLKQQQTRIVPLAIKLLDEADLALSRDSVLILLRVSGERYGEGLDWLDITVPQRRKVVEQWKAWYAGGRPRRT